MKLPRLKIEPPTLFVLFGLLSFSACQQGTETTSEENNTVEEEELPFSKDETDYLVTIETRHGTMKAILYDETPQHKENFIKLAKEGFYDSTLFHRVMQAFMIQGGDPTSKGAQPGARLGNGGPDYLIPAEFNSNLIHVRGALAAARQRDQVNPEKKSNGSQFYVVQGRKFSEQELASLQLDMNKLYNYFRQLLSDASYISMRTEYEEIMKANDPQAAQEFIVAQKDIIEKKYKVNLEKGYTPEQIETYKTVGGYPPLDREYTVFGKVIDGLEVVDKIASETTDNANRPIEDVMMNVSVEEMKKSEIYEKYGYGFGV